MDINWERRKSQRVRDLQLGWKGDKRSIKFAQTGKIY